MHAILEWLLDGLSPRRCLACGEPGAARWCQACGEPEPLSQPRIVAHTPLFAAGEYSGALASAIRRFKYERRPELAAPLASLLRPATVSLEPLHQSVFVPVPLHFERLVERGFNQSALLARALARSTGASCLPRLLVRARATGHQARLGREERRENLNEAFSVRHRCARALILVDDVVTTGTTAAGCVEALERHGMRVLAIVALARTAMKA
jgi:ComF family protein